MSRVTKNFYRIAAFLFVLTLFSLFASPVFALEWPNSPVGTAFEPTCEKPPADPPDCTPTTLTGMIKYLYEWGVVLGGLAAFVMLLVAGFQYLTSTGDPGKIKNARDRIASAIGGLVLLLSSFLILNFLNPELTTLRTPSFSVPSTDDSTQNIIANLPPAGSCREVAVYAGNNYDGKIYTDILIARDETESAPEEGRLDGFLRKKGSFKTYSYVTDEKNSDGSYISYDIKEGGICQVELYEDRNCNGNPLTVIPAPIPNIGSLQLSRNIQCVKVIRP